MEVKILVYEFDKDPYIKEVEHDDLSALQGIVGGWLEYFSFSIPEGEAYLCFCNEEGLRFPFIFYI